MSLSTPTQNLMARQPVRPPNPQTGITPDFLNALAKIAVAKDVQAKQNALALQAGVQQNPTVVQAAEQSAEGAMRGIVQQKMGLAGLQQAQAQGQAQPPGMSPPGGGANPQAMQQPQGMAAGGLTRVRSNLPQSYAGGGIIAFSGVNGSLVGDEDEELKKKVNSILPDPDVSIEGKMKMLKAMGYDVANLLAESHDRVGGVGPYTKGELRRSETRDMDPNDLRLLAAQQAAKPSAAADSTEKVSPFKGDTDSIIRALESIKDPQEKAAATAAFQKQLSGPDAGLITNAASAPAGQGGAPAAGNAPAGAAPAGLAALPHNGLGPRPVEDPADAALNAKNIEVLSKMRDSDPEAAAKASRERYIAEVEANRLKGIASSDADRAKLEELYKNAPREDGFRSALSAFIPSMVGHGGGLRGLAMGLGSGVKASDAADRKNSDTDIAQLKALSDLRAKSAQALTDNDIARLAADESGRATGTSTRNAGLNAGVSMSNVKEAVLGRKQGAWDSAEARVLGVQERLDAIKLRAAERGDDNVLNKLVMLEKQMRAQATAQAKADGINLDEGALAAKAEAILAKMMEDSALYKSLATQYGIPMAPSSTMDDKRANQFKVLRG